MKLYTAYRPSGRNRTCGPGIESQGTGSMVPDGLYVVVVFIATAPAVRSNKCIKFTLDNFDL